MAFCVHVVAFFLLTSKHWNLTQQSGHLAWFTPPMQRPHATNYSEGICALDCLEASQHSNACSQKYLLKKCAWPEFSSEVKHIEAAAAQLQQGLREEAGPCCISLALLPQSCYAASLLSTPFLPPACKLRVLKVGAAQVARCSCFVCRPFCHHQCQVDGQLRICAALGLSTPVPASFGPGKARNRANYQDCMQVRLLKARALFAASSFDRPCYATLACPVLGPARLCKTAELGVGTDKNAHRDFSICNAPLSGRSACCCSEGGAGALAEGDFQLA